MNKHVWIVEYNWMNGWSQTPNDKGYFLTYITKREANSDLIAEMYSGHPSDLRVKKYMRVER